VNIILGRLTRALTLATQTSVYHQKQHEGRRRGSYKNGVSRYEEGVNVRMTSAMKQRLDGLCATMQVERGLVIRDAVEFYLGMAEQELGSLGSLETPVRRQA
jgi:hypothetical protein